jgi:hypothetical protein
LPCAEFPGELDVGGSAYWRPVAARVRAMADKAATGAATTKTISSLLVMTPTLGLRRDSTALANCRCEWRCAAVSQGTLSLLDLPEVVSAG